MAGILSAPHCSVMCGPIGAYSARSSSRGLLRYQIGRSLSYAGAGVFAGLLGQPVVRILWNSDVTMALSWALAALLAAAAYRAWPAAKNPSGAAESLHQLGARKSEARPSAILRVLQRFPQEPALLGACSALIPCAALWSGLVIAASSASPLSGSLAMLAFSLTSGTGLLVTSFLARRLRQRPAHGRWLAFVFAAGALMLVLRPLSMQVDANTAGKVDSAMPVNCPLHPGGGG